MPRPTPAVWRPWISSQQTQLPLSDTFRKLKGMDPSTDPTGDSIFEVINGAFSLRRKPRAKQLKGMRKQLEMRMLR